MWRGSKTVFCAFASCLHNVNMLPVPLSSVSRANAKLHVSVRLSLARELDVKRERHKLHDCFEVLLNCERCCAAGRLVQLAESSNSLLVFDVSLYRVACVQCHRFVRSQGVFSLFLCKPP